MAEKGQTYKALTRSSFLKAALASGVGVSAGGLGVGAAAGARRRVSVSTVPLKMTAAAVHVQWWKDLAALWNSQGHKYRYELEFTILDPKVDLGVALADRNAPDLAYSIPGQRFVPPLWDAGVIVDLAQYSAHYGWRSRFDPALFADFGYKGRLPALGYSSLPHPFLWYDPTVFAKLGLTPPKNRRPTVAQLQSYFKAGRDAGLLPIALGNKDKWPGGHYFSLMVHRALDPYTLGKLRDNWKHNSGVKWTNTKPLNAVRQAQQRVRDGWFAPGINAMGDPEAMNLFVNSKALFYQTGFWAVQILPPVAPDLKFDFMHYPQIFPKVPLDIISFAGAGVVIGARSKYKDEVAALVDLAVSQQGQRMLLEKYNGYPATRLLAQAKNINYSQPVMRSIVSEVSHIPNRPFQVENDAPPTVQPQVMQDLQSLLDLSMSPEQWVKRTQSAIEGNR